MHVWHETIMSWPHKPQTCFANFPAVRASGGLTSEPGNQGRDRRVTSRAVAVKHQN